ncbi:MAG: hypothetical protein ACXABK_07245 [Candidatus Heimdallarchaeaceae archaeon]|jgi:hypothetical protein
MPYERMARNVNQSVFAFIISAMFSVLILALFSMDALILAIFEIPVAFLVAMIAVTECVYSYKEEVSMQTTFNMLRSLLKSFLISIPVVLLYSAIILILEETIPIFQQSLVPLFSTLQGLPVFLAIPLICFIPILIMLVALPFLLYIYGRVHLFIWGRKTKEEKALLKEEKEAEYDKEFQNKIFKIIDELDQNALRLQQYLLELQAIDLQITQVDSHESYKTLNMRLTMMRDYVNEIGLDEEKATKRVLAEEDVKKKLREIDIQKNTVTDVIKQKTKKLKDDKSKYEKDEFYDEEEEGIVTEDLFTKEEEEVVEEIKEETTEEKTEEIQEEVIEEKQEEVQKEVIEDEKKEE